MCVCIYMCIYMYMCMYIHDTTPHPSFTLARRSPAALGTRQKPVPPSPSQLSILMTTASTLAAVIATPAITAALAGTLVPVNAQALLVSTLQASSGLRARRDTGTLHCSLAGPGSPSHDAEVAVECQRPYCDVGRADPHRCCGPPPYSPTLACRATCRASAFAAFLLAVLPVQVVLLPVALGCALNQAFPRIVARVARFTPAAATLLVAVIVG
jgi:hypothetical protein